MTSETEKPKDDEPEPEEEEDEEEEEEKEKPKPKARSSERTPARTKSSRTRPADDTQFPEIKIKEEIIADITPFGWFLILGSVIAGVALYSWIQQRKAAGKGVLPDKMQERMRPHVAEQ